MASFITNRGKKRILQSFFQGGSTPAGFYAVLCTSAVAPTVDTNTLAELTQVANGNGYTTNGQALARNGTDFASLVENDTTDLAELTIKDLAWTASGGNLGAARWLVITDDHATPASRDVLACFDLVSDRTVSDGQPLTLTGAKIGLTE